MNEVKITFEDNEEILQAIDNRESIVKILGYPSEKCSLLGSKIKMGNFIDKGAYGEVYEISFPGMGKRNYVVKTGVIKLPYVQVTVNDIKEFLKHSNLKWQDIKSLQITNTINAFENNEDSKLVYLIAPPRKCLASKENSFQKIPGNYGDMLTIPNSSYMCEVNTYSEYALGVYMGKLYREGKCINFFDVHSMFTCHSPHLPESDHFTQYIIMDKIDGSLDRCDKCIDTETEDYDDPFTIINSIYIQTIAAIACYQSEYKLSHNDLHTGNLFIEYIKKDTQFNGQSLYGATYFHYSVGDKDIYFPAGDILVKIGDFGLSVKYSEPIVGDLKVFQDGYTDDLTGPKIPNIYKPSYDSLYFSTAFAILLSKNAGGNSEKIGDLVRNCIEFMCSFEYIDGPYAIIHRMMGKKFVRKGPSKRPILENLDDVKSAIDILLGPIFDRYSVKPIGSKIVTLGIISGSNKSKEWTAMEDLDLENELWEGNYSISEAATEHNRTETSVKQRLVELVEKKINKKADGEELDRLLNKFKLDPSYVDNTVAKNKEKFPKLNEIIERLY